MQPKVSKIHYVLSDTTAETWWFLLNTAEFCFAAFILAVRVIKNPVS